MRRFLLPAWIVLLSLVVVGPTLMPGFVLSFDMVFTPQQTLLPWMLGVDSGLPRAAPQDGIVSLIAGPLPGVVLQKAVLLAVPLLAGFGVRRLLRDQPLFVVVAAATLIIWNPFVAQRLIIGHWALLLTYAATPWVLVFAAKVRAGHREAVGGLVLFVALGSLVPTGGLFMALLVVPAVLWRSEADRLVRVFVVVCTAAFVSTWVLPALLSQGAATSDGAAVGVFGLEAQSWGGPWLAGLGLGGIWNSQATLPTGGSLWMPAVGLLFAALAVTGFKRLCRVVDEGLIRWLALLAVVGYGIAVLGAVFGETELVQSAFESVPGLGLLRDGQKLLGPLAVLIALAAPFGVTVIVQRFASDVRSVGRVALAALVVAPLAVMPDLAFGAFGRLSPATYPAGWETVRTAIAQGAEGDAVSVPWSAFRRYDWNDNRVVLDPTPRYMTTTVLTDDRLNINRAGKQFVVAGDNPRSSAVSAAIDQPAPLATSLPQLGVRWVIEQTDQPGQVSADKLAGLDLVVSTTGLRLWAVSGEVAVRESAVPAAVIAANLLAGFAVVAAVVAAISVRPRRDRG